MSVKLTNKNIQSFAYEGDGQSRDVRWDSEELGFGVRIYPSGRKAYIASYRAGRVKRLMVIGRYGSGLTVKEARRKAAKALALARDGQDPKEERRKAAQGETLRNLIDAFIERHAKARKKSWEKDKSRLENVTPNAWMSRRVADISRQDISDHHAKIGATRPYLANRWLENVHTMFRKATEWGFLSESASNPAKGVERFKERGRKRWVTPSEMAEIAKAIDGDGSVYVRAAVWLYLLTGARRSEILSAQWKNVDLEHGTLRLPMTKSGEEQLIPLNRPAMMILRSIPKVAGNPHILPGAKRGEHLVQIDKPWQKIRKQAGIEDVRLHDLRRTVGSWMSQAGIDLNTVRDALRHSAIATTLIYANLGAAPGRKALEDYGQRVLEATKREGPLLVTDNTKRRS